MNIKVTCDQKDCIHNVGHDVHHDHSTDACNKSGVVVIITSSGYTLLKPNVQICATKETE